ncbi:MAG: HD domain-containing phosphohydrolase [Thermomicrobiales bacterium]
MESTLRPPGMSKPGAMRAEGVDQVSPRSESMHESGVQPMDWAMPSVVVIWLAAGISAAWSVMDSGNSSASLILVGLTIVAGLAWSIRTWLCRSNRASGLAVDSLAIAGMVAVGVAAIFSGSALSPFFLALPALALVASATFRWDFLPDVVLLGTLATCLFAGIYLTIVLDEPVAPTGFYLASVAALSVAGFFAGERLSGPGARASRRRSSAKRMAAVLTDIHREKMLRAETPLEAARVAADVLQTRFSPTYVAVAELIPETTILRAVVERGALDLDADKLRSGLASLSQEAISDGQPRQIYDDGANLNALVCRRLGVKALAIVPLWRLGASLGVIHIAWRELEDQRLIDDAIGMASELSPWITPDLAISRVAGDMERGYLTAVAAVSASFDESDAHSSGHSRRVAKVALEIAEILELSEHDQRQLLYAAEVHDLGRIGISNQILTKRDALTDEEWTQVKRIPVLGAGIVEPVSFFGDARDAVLHLRERWDGEGYPDGLKEEDIPLLARILAVAEAYDAMTSPRPYRDAMSSTDALRQLWTERGKTFDPQIVESFVMHRAPQRGATV